MKIKGLLIDLDGVLYVGHKAIDGAVEAIDYIKSKGLPCRFATNTTTKSAATLHRKLTSLGLPIEKNEIISAPRAAVMHLRKIGSPTCHLCLNDDVSTDFAEFDTTYDRPDVVIIGDIDDRWTYVILNRLFRMVIGGADIVALHKGKYWHESDGLRLDIGAFVAGLEYASGRTATVIGKPNKAFFKLAVDDMNLPSDSVIMIGDDIDSDVGGAQAAGLKGALVKTGKYRKELVSQSTVKPDAILASISDIKELL